MVPVVDLPMTFLGLSSTTTELEARPISLTTLYQYQLSKTFISTILNDLLVTISYTQSLFLVESVEKGFYVSVLMSYLTSFFSLQRVTKP